MTLTDTELRTDVRLGVSDAQAPAAVASTLLVTAENGRVLFVRPDR